MFTKWKQGAAAATLICLFVAAPVIARPSTAKNGPVIVVERETYTFAEAEAGSRITAEFPFRNDGDAMLEIREVRATCECTEAFAIPERLEPGEGGAIIVELDTSYRLGDLDKEAIVVSNDPVRPEVTLHIKGKTWQPLTFKPAPVFFDNLVPGVEATAEVALTNTGKRPVTIKKLLASNPDLKFAVARKDNSAAKLPLKLAVGETVSIRLTLRPDPGEKRDVSRQLVVVTDPAPITPLVLKVLGILDGAKKAE